MPALNFKKQFAPMVINGSKTHTIRAYRKDGRNPKEGDMLYLYTGMRTKGCKKLKEVVCTEIKMVDIEENGNVIVDGFELTHSMCVHLAQKDGFVDTVDRRCDQLFIDFFRQVHGLPFRGVLISWG